MAPARGTCRSKAAAAASGKSALNKATLEAYLRDLELWPSQVQIKIDDPKPYIRGLNQVDVHLSAGAATKDITYYVSTDGKTVIRGIRTTSIGARSKPNWTS